MKAAFYEVNDPAITGQRTELISSKPMLMIVLAQKTAEIPTFAELPQQSDYAAVWASHEKNHAGDQALSHAGLFRRLRIKMNPYWPFWLRRYRDALIRLRHGVPSLNNRRHFRRLNQKEIFCKSLCSPHKKS
jgi:hypothetical protein